MLYPTDYALVPDLKAYHPSAQPPTSIFYMYINGPQLWQKEHTKGLGETTVLIRSDILYTPAPLITTPPIQKSRSLTRPKPKTLLMNSIMLNANPFAH
jgi:hypothetical protein